MLLMELEERKMTILHEMIMHEKQRKEKKKAAGFVGCAVGAVARKRPGLAAKSKLGLAVGPSVGRERDSCCLPSWSIILALK